MGFFNPKRGILSRRKTALLQKTLWWLFAFVVAILYLSPPDAALEAVAAVLVAALGLSDTVRYQSTGVTPWRPAHWLVCTAKEGALEVVLRLGLVSLNTPDSRGATMLHYAAAECLGWTTQILLEHGADSGLLDPTGRTPLELAVARHQLVLEPDGKYVRCAYTRMLLEAPPPPTDAAVADAVATQKELQLTTVARHRIDELDVESYVRDYASQGRAVVLEGAAEAMGCSSWTPWSIVNKCGDPEVEPSQYDPSLTMEWAKLRPSSPKPIKLSTFLTAYEDAQKSRTLKRTSPRIFDVQMNGDLGCNGTDLLRRDFHMPAHIAVDFDKLNRTGPAFGNAPSVFVDAAASRSGTHIDAYNSAFWMLILSGGKTFRIFPAEQRRLLYPTRDTVNFAPDVFAPVNYAQFPLLRLATGLEAKLRPGDLLIIPGGSIHQVANDDDTFALAGNFVDEFTWPQAQKSAERHLTDASKDSRSLRLLELKAAAGGMIENRKESAAHRKQLLANHGVVRGGTIVIPYAVHQAQFEL